MMAKRSPDNIGRALREELEVELREVIVRTPVDKGPLRASEHIEGPKRVGRRVSASIVAGGPSAPYALEVHENLDAYHKVGEAKYIESVLNESGPYLMQRVAKRLGSESSEGLSGVGRTRARDTRGRYVKG